MTPWSHASKAASRPGFTRRVTVTVTGGLSFPWARAAFIGVSDVGSGRSPGRPASLPRSRIQPRRPSEHQPDAPQERGLRADADARGEGGAPDPERSFGCGLEQQVE